MDLVPIANKELEFGDKIGSGSEGSVFKGKWRLFKNGMEEIREVAIKKLFLSTDISELKTLSGLNHPNIINVYGYVEEHHECNIVMELCQYSLRDYFKRNPSPLSDEHLLRWSLEAALPLEYLREHNILHRDVKPENYVVDSGMVLKLTDFGVARDLDCTVSNFTHVGTWRWMAPEVHGVEGNRLLLSPSYDIFALGLVLWYLVERKMPYGEFESHNHYAITTAIINGKRPVIPAKCPVKLAELIQKCWSGDRKDRPKISQVILVIKDVIASLQTTGTLLRIEDMSSVETTGTLPQLTEASGPSKSQAIPASQVDVTIRKTKPKAKVYYGSSNDTDDSDDDDNDDNYDAYCDDDNDADDYDNYVANEDDDNDADDYDNYVANDDDDNDADDYDNYVANDYDDNDADDYDNYVANDDDDNDTDNYDNYADDHPDDDNENDDDTDDDDDDNNDDYDDDGFEGDDYGYIVMEADDRSNDAKPERIMHGEQINQDLTANELPNKCTQPSAGQEKSKMEVDLTLQVSAADKPVPQTQNISEKGNEQNKVLDKENVQEVCLEDGPETKIGEQKRRSSVWLCVML